MKKQIQKINFLLIKHFGIPPRAVKKPDPLDTIIGTILSQNTNDRNSYKAYRNLKNSFKNWDELARLRPVQIEKYIKIAGLGKQKSRAIFELLKALKIRNNEISLDYIKSKNNLDIISELTTHKGIGVKTASCVLLFSLDRNVCPVDTHVHRTLNRIGLVRTSIPVNTFYEIMDKIPDGTAHSLHTYLIRLGREICKPSRPICSVCPLTKLCKFDHKSDKDKIVKKTISFMLLDNL